MGVGTGQKRAAGGQWGRALGTEQKGSGGTRCFVHHVPTRLAQASHTESDFLLPGVQMQSRLSHRAGAEPSRGFHGNLSVCGPGGPLLCSQNICPVRFTLYFWVSRANLNIHCGFQPHHLFGGNGISSGCFEVRRNVWVVFIVVPSNKLFFLRAPPLTPGGRLNCCRELCPSLSSARPVVLKVGFPDSSINITWELVRKADAQASQT